MRFLSVRSPAGLAASSLVLLLGVAWIDYVTDWEVSMVFFYLVPIALVSWFGAPWAGNGMAVLAAGTWALDDWLMGHHYSRSVIPYWNALMELCIFMTVATILSSLKHTLEREKKLARTDPVTGSPNARAFREEGLKELMRALRAPKPLTLAYMDLDDFKHVNARFGHQGGDALLRRIAEIVRERLRPYDLFARMGGDEFAVLFPETGLHQARELLENIQQALVTELNQPDLFVSFSIGTVTCLQPLISLDEMLRRADAAMYAAKRTGKNMIVQQAYPSEVTDEQSVGHHDGGGRVGPGGDAGLDWRA